MASRVVLTGSHVVLYVNGKVIGRVTSFKWTRKAAIKYIQGVDTLLPSELVRGPVQVSGQIGIMRTLRDGGAEGAGLLVPDLDLNREQYVSLLLKDRVSDAVVAKVDRALIESEGWGAEVKGIVTATIGFAGMSLRSEVKPVTPQS